VLVVCPMALYQEQRLFGLDIEGIEGKLEHRIEHPVVAVSSVSP
jgi:hypothetical protein